MDITNDNLPDFLRMLEMARDVHESDLFPDFCDDWMVAHDFLMENPCRHDDYVIHHIYEEQRYLDL